jgi:hypothetical protein
MHDGSPDISRLTGLTEVAAIGGVGAGIGPDQFSTDLNAPLTPGRNRQREMKASRNILICNSSIHNPNEVTVAPLPNTARKFHAGLVVGFIAAFGLVWGSGTNSYHFLNILPGRPHTQKPPLSHRILGAEKNLSRADNLSARTTIEPSWETLSTRKLPFPAPSARRPVPPGSNAARKPSFDGPQPAPASPRAVSLIVPETRPTTIEGWTIQNVENGMVTLEGPNGVWKAAHGDTIPGVGRVDSIVLWGSRWIVATSKGLITTQ